jgi:tetratricopeptide (TPR) repeat protein
MPRCWTCGNILGAVQLNCSSCQGTEALENIKKSSGGNQQNISIDFANLVNNFNSFEEKIEVKTVNLASIMEWGLAKTDWERERQAEVLKSIDFSLKTPAENQANEWRLMAGKCLEKNAFDEAEKHFFKALDSNPRDYRIYVGFAHACLGQNKFDEALICLENSLPHAPVGNYAVVNGKGNNKYESWPFDYKSYSYRLIGRIYYCNENYQKACSCLKTALALSPQYFDALYDYAQYSALVGDVDGCKKPLEQAVLGVPSFLYLAQKEKNFDAQRDEIQGILTNILIEHILGETYRVGEYINGIFELSKYCAGNRNVEFCVDFLEQLIRYAPTFYNKIQNEEVFKPIESEVQNLLTSLSSSALKNAEESIRKAEADYIEVDRVYKTLLKKDSTYRESANYKNLQKAKTLLSSKDYLDFLEAQKLADEGIKEAGMLKSDAIKASGGLKEKKNFKIAKVKEYILGYSSTGASMLGRSLMAFIYGWFITGSSGCIYRALMGTYGDDLIKLFIPYAKAGIIGGLTLMVIVNFISIRAILKSD